ncbi:MAG: hypothetical protein FWG39_03650 [Alphaproteobacteria bacterium]|nr:hypothetical protein [Alphaproteobacteria bacterium]
MKYNIARVCQCDDTSCASANYTMVANALGFGLSLADILKVTGGTLGMARFWREMLSRGVRIKCISKNNYAGKIKPKWVADFFAERGAGAESFSDILKNPNFDFERRAPTKTDLQKLFGAGYAVEIMGDGWLMYGDAPDAQLLHRVFITDISGDKVYFHDPAADGDANHKSKMSDIITALSVAGAEIVGYRTR